jgi:hypothetical protein
VGSWYKVRVDRPDQLYDPHRLKKKLIRYSALLAAGLVGVLGACSENTAPGSEPTATEVRTPAKLVANGDTDFVAVVGTTIEPGPAVRVLDEKNQPVAGVPVKFGPAPGKVVISGPDGVASFGPWRVDTLAREYFLDASVAVSAQQELVVVFHARATPGTVARLIAVSGNNQVGYPGRALSNQLYAKVTDMYNNPISGVVVSFSVASGGGIIDLTSSTTGSLGVAASGRWSLGMTSPQRAIAKAGELEALFEATFCEAAQTCDLVPEKLAYVRDGAVWISGANDPTLVARDASRPSWSPDGSRLAFFKVNGNREEEAICISAEPFSSVACTPVDVVSRSVAAEMRVSWAPDGRTLALSRIYYGAGNSQLLFLDVASMTIRRHGTIDEGVWSASWSPDGKKIAIASNARVYLANADGSGLEVLLPDPVWELAWAPDGQKIAVITVLCPWDCFGADVALLNPTSKTLTIVERGQGSGFNSLTWSPDANLLAYSAWNNTAAMRDVRIMSIANSSGKVVLTNASDPSWRP